MTTIFLQKIVSGGQTGVDRAALDFASQIGLESGGWCPKGRLALDGRIPDKYPLKETQSSSYPQRTQMNIQDSDGTLIISRGVLHGGTALTHRLANKLGKPCLILDLNYIAMKQDAANHMLLTWLAKHTVNTLNIAGPRENDSGGVYDGTINFLMDFWLKAKPSCKV
ncbi:MAG: putative molybdenum carrier protein [Magnetococcales bacterium]|nr:putative molybdenum carrier protein [Magnetococcales bacterium]